jgi:hypothetical protein
MPVGQKHHQGVTLAVSVALGGLDQHRESTYQRLQEVTQ